MTRYGRSLLPSPMQHRSSELPVAIDVVRAWMGGEYTFDFLPSSNNIHPYTPVGLAQLACAHREGQSCLASSMRPTSPLRKVRGGYLLQNGQGLIRGLEVFLYEVVLTGVPRRCMSHHH
ncbi:hypothetical protein TNIN_207041 [Trichonephila inaurata madagascariensis]|uniref:Uncharacterized protein n=1 Tax=Trichonephila inaurata madagascariensis TaxID=2747483 RepID=A0A8X6XLY4_9ARAC|nr:hypothetical protein TNIN_207041 [Trichonephila inaurata madagascariensis]